MKVHSYLLTISISLCTLQAQNAPSVADTNTPIEAITGRKEKLQDLTKLPLEAWSTEAIQNKARQGDVRACIIMAHYWNNLGGDEEEVLPIEKLQPFLDCKEHSEAIVNDAEQWTKYWIERALETNDPRAKLAKADIFPSNLSNAELTRLAKEVAKPLALKGDPSAIIFILDCDRNDNDELYQAVIKGLKVLKNKAEKQEPGAAADYYNTLDHAIDNEEISKLIPEAIQYLRLAASKDDVNAILALADGIHTSSIPSEKPNEYESLLQRGANLNDIRAIHRLSMDTNDENITKACYKRLAELGDASALMSHALELIQRNEGVKALAFLERAIALGGTEAMNILCHLYEGNAGVPANPQKAFDLAKKMVDQQSTIGMLKLARFYEEGFGCTADPEKAHDLIQWAARSPFSDAYIALARSYLLGIGCPKNESFAYRLLQELYNFNPNLRGIAFLLGYCNEEGYGTKLNLKEALRFYKEGAEQEDPKAMNNLATMYRIGTASELNLPLAKRLYAQAAKLGNTEAQKNLDAISSSKSTEIIKKAQTK